MRKNIIKHNIIGSLLRAQAVKLSAIAPKQRGKGSTLKAIYFQFVLGFLTNKIQLIKIENKKWNSFNNCHDGFIRACYTN